MWLARHGFICVVQGILNDLLARLLRHVFRARENPFADTGSNIAACLYACA